MITRARSAVGRALRRGRPANVPEPPVPPEDLDIDDDAMADDALDVDAAPVAIEALEGEDTTAPYRARAPHDLGELYGQPTATAADRHPAIDEAGGEHVFEDLLASATEMGADPEQGLDVIADDETVDHDVFDEVPADKGAGGPPGR